MFSLIAVPLLALLIVGVVACCVVRRTERGRRGDRFAAAHPALAVPFAALAACLAGAPSLASQSRIIAAVQSGASSCGRCPMSRATSRRQPAFAAAASRAEATETSRSRSPCSRRTGTVMRLIRAR